MRTLSRLVFFIAVLSLVGGGVFLAAYDFPVPARTVEKVLPDDRFPR